MILKYLSQIKLRQASSCCVVSFSPSQTIFSSPKMTDKLNLIKHNSLYRSTAINAAVQLLAVAICTAILFLFVALSYSEITLPRYTTQYAQKDTQQLINLIVAVVAVVIGIWLSHCRRYMEYC